MSTSTLAIVNGATLQDGLVELLRIGEALAAAEGEACGVAIYRDQDDGHALEIEPDPELPPGVLENVTRLPVDPWEGKGVTVHRLPELVDAMEAAAERRQLLEYLAAATYGDIIATTEGVHLL